MREIKNTKIIAVDHGYGNIKTANTVTPTGITAYESEPIFTGNILEYNGIYYRIGEGHKEFMPDKAMDRDYYLLTLMAIARELNVHSIQEADVHLAAGLPLTWIRKQREEFRSYLLQDPEIRYRFNHKDYHIRLVGCSLYPQGYPAIVNRLGELKGINLLADIGNADHEHPVYHQQKSTGKPLLDREIRGEPVHAHCQECHSRPVRGKD